MTETRGSLGSFVSGATVHHCTVLVSLSLSYMYTRDNGVPIGLFRQFRLDLQTCFDVLAVSFEVQIQR